MNQLLAPLRISLVYLWLFGACLIGLLISPFRWKDPDLNHDIGRLFGRIASRFARLRVRLENAQALAAHQPCVYVINHQSGLDVATLGCFFPPNTLGIGKIELIWIPFFGQYLWASGNILIRRQSRRHALSGMSQAAQAIRDRRVSVILFPEGTRNTTDAEFLPFKKGAFHLAIEAQVPIVPLVHSPLKGLPDKPTDVVIRVLDPIDTRGMTRENMDSLMQLTRERMLEAFRGLSLNRP